MTSVNEMNAVMRERARIREEVIKIPLSVNIPGAECIRRAEVLTILNGEKLLPKAEVWPSSGDIFYRINSQGYIIEATWSGSEKQKSFLEYGNVFRTKEQAEKARNSVAEALAEGKKY